MQRIKIVKLKLEALKNKYEMRVAKRAYEFLRKRITLKAMLLFQIFNICKEDKENLHPMSPLNSPNMHKTPLSLEEAHSSEQGVHAQKHTFDCVSTFVPCTHESK